jgi:hypothetical protein
MKGLTAERAASWLRQGAYRVFCLLHNLPDTLRAQGALSGTVTVVAVGPSPPQRSRARAPRLQRSCP